MNQPRIKVIRSKDKKGLSIHPGLTLDDKPTQGSKNAVKSGGVFTALEEKVDKEEGYGLSAIQNATVLTNSVDGANDTSILFERQDGTVEETKIYNKSQIDKKLSELPSGGGEASQIKIISGVNLDHVIEPGVYRVWSDCENIPDVIKTLDNPITTMYVTNDGGDAEYVDAHQILFAVDTEGVACIFQRDIQKHLKPPYDVYAYPWGTVSGGGGVDLSDYYTKAEVEAYIEETLLGGAW